MHRTMDFSLINRNSVFSTKNGDENKQKKTDDNDNEENVLKDVKDSLQLIEKDKEVKQMEKAHNHTLNTIEQEFQLTERSEI